MLLLGLVFLFMLAGNRMTGMTMDDYLFSLNLKTYGPTRSLKHIFESLVYLRRLYNGRVFAHFFAQLFLLLPRAVFQPINAANCTLLFYMMYRFVRRDKRRDVFLLLFLLAAVWLLLPAWGQVFLWLTGSCNYSWTMTFSFLFLSPFLGIWLGRDLPRPQKTGTRILFLLLSFVAGAYSENGALAMLFTAFCLLVLQARRDGRPDRFLSLAFLVGCCGFLFLMLSPSELNGRQGEVAESSVAHVYYRLTALAERLLGRSLPGWLLAAVLIIGLLAAALLVWLFLRRRRLGCGICAALLVLGCGALAVLAAPELKGLGAGEAAAAVLSDTKLSLLAAFTLYGLLLLAAFARGADGRTLLCALVLGLAAVGSLAVFLFALYFPARSACPAIFYTVLADALLLDALWDLGQPRPLRILSVVLTLGMLLSLTLAVPDLIRTGRGLRQRQEELLSLQKAGAAEVVIDPVRVQTKYSAHWPGDQTYFDYDIAIYYGFESLEIREHVNEE